MQNDIRRTRIYYLHVKERNSSLEKDYNKFRDILCECQWLWLTSCTFPPATGKMIEAITALPEDGFFIFRQIYKAHSSSTSRGQGLRTICCCCSLSAPPHQQQSPCPYNPFRIKCSCHIILARDLPESEATLHSFARMIPKEFGFHNPILIRNLLIISKTREMFKGIPSDRILALRNPS